MTRDKLTPAVLVLALLVGLMACSSESDEQDNATPTMADDRLEIETVLAETAGRWRYGDKAILYEQEFEYLRMEHTYDSYLEIDRIKRMESDTVVAFRVRDMQLFDRDSAMVSVDVVFVGPSEDTTYLPQEWMMYYHLGRWIRPTLSNIKFQLDFEERRRLADSAAAAEEEDDW